MLKIDRRGLDTAMKILAGEDRDAIASEYGVSKQRVMQIANRAVDEIYNSYRGLVSECGCWQCNHGEISYSHSITHCLHSPVVWRTALIMYNEMEKIDANLFKEAQMSDELKVRV